MLVLSGTNLTITYIVIALHVLCMILLVYSIVILKQREMRVRLNNQRLILINLCVIEFLTALSFVKLQIEEIFKRTKSTMELEIEFGIRVVFALVYPLAMQHIALDRFLEVRLHLKYPICITNKLTNLVTLGIWVFGALLSVVLLLLTKFIYTIKDIIQFMSLYVFVMDITIALNAILIYLYLYRVYSKLRRIDRRNSLHRIQKGKFRIPIYIISTYCLFEVSGSLLTMTAHTNTVERTLLVRKISLILYGLGFLADVFIYIFSHKLNQRRLRQERKRESSTINMAVNV